MHTTSSRTNIKPYLSHDNMPLRWHHQHCGLQHRNSNHHLQLHIHFEAKCCVATKSCCSFQGSMSLSFVMHVSTLSLPSSHQGSPYNPIYDSFQDEAYRAQATVTLPPGILWEPEPDLLSRVNEALGLPSASDSNPTKKTRSNPPV